jgi:hypothetical protein
MEAIQVYRYLPVSLSQWRDWHVALGLVGLILLAGGCTVKVPVHPEVGALDIKERIPLDTALLVTEDTRNYIFRGYPENLTAGARWHDFLLGESLEQGSLQAFSQVFQQVNVVRTEADAKHFQLVIEPKIEDFHFRYDQVTYGPFRTGVLSKITVRVTLAAGETKLWEHSVESPWQRKGPWVVNFSVEEEAGQSASEAIAFTLRKLAMDIAEDRSIRQFATARR